MTLQVEARRPETSLPGSRIAGLDGLRAVAVVLVLAYHLFPAAVPGGFIGVDVFFVISGFLVTTLLIRERATGPIRVGGFWVRRGRRLLPALILLLILSLPAALLVGGDVLVGIAPQVLGALTFSSNWVDIAQDQSYFLAAAPQVFRNLWSLAVEEQFYLLWPIVIAALIAVARRSAVIITLLALAAVSSALWMGVLYTPGSDPSRVYYGSDTHLFGLALGAALAFALARRKPLDIDAGETAAQHFERVHASWMGFAALMGIVGSALLLSAEGAATYRGGLLAVCMLTCLVIVAASTPRSRLGRLLDAAPLRFIGQRSYGIYLWHWPILVLLQSAAARGIMPEATETQVAALTAALTAGIAVLSHRYLETPIRQRGWRQFLLRFATTKLRIIFSVAIVLTLTALATTAILAAPTATVAQTHIERGQHALATASPQPSPPPPSHTPATPTQPTRSGETPPPTPSPTQVDGTHVTAVGDSVMLASTPELQKALSGIAIDAQISRQPSAAPELLERLAQAGQLRSLVVLGLGTNGYWGTGTLERVLDVIGPNRKLVLVTAYAPRSWVQSVNAYDAQIAAAHPKQVALADWASAIDAQTSLLAPDRIHPDPAGGTLYANTVAEAVTQLGR